MDSEKKILKGFFSIISLWNLLIPGRGQFEPQEYDLQEFCWRDTRNM